MDGISSHRGVIAHLRVIGFRRQTCAHGLVEGKAAICQQDALGAASWRRRIS
jgi:hypothetical protein